MPSYSNFKFINGKIFTANINRPYAEAMIVRNNKIAWIGDEKEMPNVHGDVINLGGKRVLPGLIDAHMHPLMLANTSKKIACMPPVVNSIKDLIKEIKSARESQAVDKWIEGWGYDEGKLAEGRSPDRWDLDTATVDVPVIITRTCGHIVVVNSKALEMAGITRNTLNPQGGEIDRDKNGDPTGILRENAKDLLSGIIPTKSIKENVLALAELSPKLLAHGITAISELMARTGPQDYLDIYHSAVKKGLRQRAVLHYLWEDLQDESILPLTKTRRDQQVHVGGIKLFADGSVSGQTAWVNPSFLSNSENYGIQMTTSDELLAAAKAAELNGIQLVIHAMGEQAINLIVNTFYEREGWLKDAPSIRIEHAAMPTAQAIERAAKAGIAFVPQPIFLFAETESYLKNLGDDRTKLTYPIQTMLQAGIKVAFSSDAPATAWADPANPFIGMKAAVTRKAYDGTDIGEEQKVDIETAIILYTRAAQEITRIPNVGQLASGYQADFIVLDQDILLLNSNKFDEIKVLKTYMGGELVYQRDIVSQN